MTIQDIILKDIPTIFTVEGNTPLSVQAVYTAIGGTPDPAVTVFYSNIPLHGDEQQRYEVEEEAIFVVAKASDVKDWAINGKVTINDFDYEIAEEPYPRDGYWSVLALRTPTRNKTKI
jgi:hypothetical protein